MTLEQIFLPNMDLNASELTITGSEFHHLKTVRRFKPQQQVVAVDGEGHARTLTLTEFQKDLALANADSVRMSAGELTVPVTLCIANLKSDHLEWVVEKSTELGVSRIIPLMTEHTVKHGLRKERLERIAISALKQSGRSRKPEICDLTPVLDVLKKLPSGEHWFCMATAGAIPVKKMTIGLVPTALTIWIGPEGDWSELEIELARQQNLKFVWLGERRLRAETAALCALSIASQWIDPPDSSNN